MPNVNEQPLHTILRWMTENLEVASAVYRTQASAIAIDPTLTIDQNGHPARQVNALAPGNLDSWFLNSACGLLASCYMDALGKIHMHGKGGNRQHFESFINIFMLDFVAECNQKGAPYTIATLWTTYRNGFVHQFAAGAAVWGRQGRAAAYWFDNHGHPAINIDRLVVGTTQGIAAFRSFADGQVANGAVTYGDLATWLGAVV
jgi:hypothetical protein